MAQNDEQRMPNSVSQYAAQLHKAQQNLKQFIPKYRRLVEAEKRLRLENRQLRAEIEHFNQSLSSRDQECEALEFQVAEIQGLLQRLHHEEQRSPALHARAGIRRKLCRGRPSPAAESAGQDILPLNIWLVSSNRFVEQVIGYYARERERLLIIEHGMFVRTLLEVGVYPDIILTGAYDFGLDDPFQQSFASMLDELSSQAPPESGLHACFIITLSASVPAQARPDNAFPFHAARHKYVSKLHGLRATISEIRFFLELRRCQQDILEAEWRRTITSLSDVTPVMTTVRQQAKTGVLTVLSREAPPDIRWALQCFFLRGKLVKTDHTLEAAATLSPEGELTILRNEFPASSADAEYAVNAPEHLFFFPLYEQTVLREMRAPAPQMTED